MLVWNRRRKFLMVLGLLLLAAGAWKAVGGRLYITTGSHCNDQATANALDARARLFIDALSKGSDWTRTQATERFNASHATLHGFKLLAGLPLESMRLTWTWGGRGRGPVRCGSGVAPSGVVHLGLDEDVEFAILNYRLSRPVMNVDVALQFVKTSPVDWGVDWVHVYSSSDHGRSASDYEAEGDRQAAADQPIGAAFSYLAASAMTLSIPGIRLDAGDRLEAKLAELREGDAFRDAISKESIPRAHDYLSLSVMAFGNDGLYAIASYVSDTVDERSRSESRGLMKSLQMRAPALERLFAGMAAFAYGEVPRDPSKTYERFGTTFPFEATEP